MVYIQKLRSGILIVFKAPLNPDQPTDQEFSVPVVNAVELGFKNLGF